MNLILLLGYREWLCWLSGDGCGGEDFEDNNGREMKRVISCGFICVFSVWDFCVVCGGGWSRMWGKRE